MIDGELALRRSDERWRVAVATTTDAAAEICAFAADEVGVVTAFGDEVRLVGAELKVFIALLFRQGATLADAPTLTMAAWQASDGLWAAAA